MKIIPNFGEDLSQEMRGLTFPTSKWNLHKSVIDKTATKYFFQRMGGSPGCQVKEQFMSDPQASSRILLHRPPWSLVYVNLCVLIFTMPSASTGVNITDGPRTGNAFNFHDVDGCYFPEVLELVASTYVYIAQFKMSSPAFLWNHTSPPSLEFHGWRKIRGFPQLYKYVCNADLRTSPF